jgi:flagellar hook assembly protein FlgD
VPAQLWLRTSRRALVALVAVCTGVVPAVCASVARADGLQVTYHSASAEFSPNGDGQEDQADLSYCVSAPATVTTTITPEGSPVVVKTLESMQPRDDTCSTARSVTWNGTDDLGAGVPDGRYTVHVRAVGDGDLGVADASWTLVVERRVPGTIASPHAGDLLSGTTDVVLTPTPGFPHQISSFLAQAAAQLAYSATCVGSTAEAPGVDGNFHSALPTAGCPGANRLTALVRYTDEFGGRHTYFAQMLVEMDSPLRIARTTRSQEFSPNGDGWEDSARVAYCLSRAAAVTTTIAPEGSSTVARTFETGVARSGDCYATGDGDSASFSWKGRDDTAADLPDGRYTVHVHAVPTRGDTTPADASWTLIVLRALPGAITTPHAGDTIGGSTDVTFTPAPAFPHPISSFFSFASGCRGTTATAPASDGTLVSTLDATGCTTGSNTIRGVANYTDDLGVTHGYPVPGVGVEVGATALSLTASAPALYTGTQVRVSGVLSQAGTPLAGRRVLFSVESGPNAPRSRTLTTGPGGNVRFSYYGTNPWLGTADDTIRACDDANGDGACGPDEAAQTATVEWAAARRMTVGLGTLAYPDEAHSVSVVNDSLYCDQVSFASKLAFRYALLDGSDAHTVALTSLQSKRCSDAPELSPGGVVEFDTMDGSGTCSLDGVGGYGIRFQLADHGEPGARAGDTLAVTVTDPGGATVLSFSTPIAAGNLNSYQGAIL